YTSLVTHAETVALIEREVAQANELLARAEQVKAFRVLPRELDPEQEGEPVTPTRKVKRRLLAERYGALLDAMYGDAEERRAAANAKKFAEGVILIVNASISPTYKPLMTEAEAEKIPLLFGGGVCPKEAFPPAHPLIFCSTSFGAQWDSRFAVPFIKAQAGG